MFVTFYAETEAGRIAWNELASKSENTGKFLAIHLASILKQLNDAGYSACNIAKPKTKNSPAGSLTFVLLVSYPLNEMAGQYLEGPRSRDTVKKLGYGFTPDIEKAWPFPTERKALTKARIVERHMQWGEGVLIAEPNETPVSA
jgi:hypothetical protein